MPKISFIILNWNGWRDTIECLESLYRINYPDYEVIVVDNFSTNDSLQKIRGWTQGEIEVESKYFKSTKCTHNIEILEYAKADLENKSYLEEKYIFDKLESNKKLFLLKNDKNDGFAGGNNIAIKQILEENTSDFIFFLNNDTFIEKDLISELTQKLNLVSSDNIGLIGPKIFNYFTNTHQIKYYGTLKDEVTKVDCISGAAFLVNVAVLRDIGLFDELFFLYCEDTDLCYRVGQKYTNYYFQTDAKVFHKIESSSQNISKFKIILQIRNLFIIFRRHKKYLLIDLLRSMYFITKNNIKIHFFLTIYCVFLGIIKGIYFYCKNPKINY